MQKCYNLLNFFTSKAIKENSKILKIVMQAPEAGDFLNIFLYRFFL